MKIENKELKTKRIIRIIAMAMIMCLFVTFATGCGIIPVNESHAGDTYPATALGDKEDKLIVKWDNMYTTIDISGQSVKQNATGMLALTLDSEVFYANGTDKTPISFTRQIALVMFISLFKSGGDLSTFGTAVTAQGTHTGAGEYRPIEDKFVPSNGMHTQDLSLQPVTLIKNITKATHEVITHETGLLPGTTPSVNLHDIINWMQALACGILISIWSMGFITQIVNERFTMETLLKSFMQLLCGILVVLNSKVIVGAFASVANSLLNDLDESSIASFDTLRQEIAEELKYGITAYGFIVDAGIIRMALGAVLIDFGGLTALVMLIIPFIGQVMCAYQIISQLITRMIELIVRITLAPIPIAFGVQNGFSQETIRYLRGIMACALQPVIMIVGALCLSSIADIIMFLFNSSYVFSPTPVVGASNTTSGVLGVMGLSIAYFVLSAFLGGTKQMAQEIVAR